MTSNEQQRRVDALVQGWLEDPELRARWRSYFLPEQRTQEEQELDRSQRRMIRQREGN